MYNGNIPVPPEPPGLPPIIAPIAPIPIQHAAAAAGTPIHHHDNDGVGDDGDNNSDDTCSEGSNTKHNASGFNPAEPRPSQRLKDAKLKMDNAYAKQEAAREVVNRITKELEHAVSYLEECSAEYKKECEAFRLIELGDPSQWVCIYIILCNSELPQVCLFPLCILNGSISYHVSVLARRLPSPKKKIFQNNYYKKLCDYKTKYGHCRVPYETKGDPELSALGRWVRVLPAC